jgi:methyltransferase
MTSSAGIATVALVLMGGAMIFEALHSLRNERELRRRGAVEPPDDVFRLMRAVYPTAFLAMAMEGGLGRGAESGALLAGVLVLVAAKAVKYWAIATLGDRWSFRVLVLPGAPLLSSGPYRVMRHPNYLGVLGELLGMSLVTGAPVSGAASLVLFGLVVARRIAVEERALRATPPSR